MKIEQLMEFIHEAYPDETTRECWDDRRQSPRHPTRGGPGAVRAGDSLAEFVVREIYETFDKDASDDEQISRALNAMDAALGDLGAVAAALKERLEGIVPGETANEDTAAR